MDEARNFRLMKYGDKSSLIALWLKVFFLLPAWGVIPVIILGFFTWRMGGLWVELGYLVILGCACAYFIEDVLKRKLKIKDDILYFGYRKFPLAKLRALSIVYDNERLMPQKLRFSFDDEKMLFLRLTRMQSQDVHFIIKQLETKFPQCAIDPILKTMLRCHEINPRLKRAGGPVEVPYNTHRTWTDLKDAFMTNLSGWSRMGPVLAWLISMPLWVAFTAGTYQAAKLSGIGRTVRVQDLLFKLASKANSAVSDVVQSASKTLFDVMSHPVAGCLAALVVVWLALNLFKKLGQPTLLILDDEQIKLYQKIRHIRYQLCSFRWADVHRVELKKPKPDSPPETWKISLQASNNTSLVDLDFAALDEKGRSDIYEHLKAFSTGLVISPELAETFLPRQHGSYTELWLQSLSGSPNRENLDPLGPGHVLQSSRYEIMGKLGVGGQGAAYLARENSLVERSQCQQVVLKETILPIFVDNTVRRQALERFEHEARTLGVLDHERVVRLIDFFVEDHRGYLVLEHIEGTNLRDATLGKPVGEKEALRLAGQMCDVLEYLHSKNVIHRDFTPDNLILEKGGQLKLIDFNVAQTVDTGMTGTVVGKHAYVPPEQFRGKPSVRSDIYAMGCSLFHILAGKDPQPITPSDVRTVRDDISTEFATVIKKCTSLKEENRYQSIEELKAVIAELIEVNQAIEASEESVEDEGGTIVLERMPEYEPIVMAEAEG